MSMSSTVTQAAADYSGQMEAVGALALVVGVSVWGLRTAWHHFKSLSSDGSGWTYSHGEYESGSDGSEYDT